MGRRNFRGMCISVSMFETLERGEVDFVRELQQLVYFVFGFIDLVDPIEISNGGEYSLISMNTPVETHIFSCVAVITEL